MVINIEDSSILKIIKFPDGQQQVSIKTEYIHLVRNWGKVDIYCRICSFSDLEKLICLNKSLREIKGNKSNIQVHITYLLGARSDRKFEEGGNNYLKNVICPIINAQKFSKVSILNPHSDVVEACIDNFKNWMDRNPIYYIKEISNNFTSEINIIIPDAGAQKKTYKLLQAIPIGYSDKINVIEASKTRDIISGNIKSTNIDTKSLTKKPTLIIDDICDGGRTFIELSKLVEPIVGKENMYLYVTHGIFSNGLEELQNHFNQIGTTNSFSNKYEESTFLKYYKVI